MLVHAAKYMTGDRLKTDTLQKLNTTQKKANNTKHSRTKLAWFSRIIRYSTRKWGGLILQCSRAHKGQLSGIKAAVQVSCFVLLSVCFVIKYQIYVQRIYQSCFNVVNNVKNKELCWSVNNPWKSDNAKLPVEVSQHAQQQTNHHTGQHTTQSGTACPSQLPTNDRSRHIANICKTQCTSLLFHDNWL